MYCEQCGAKNEPGSAVCSVCGAALAPAQPGGPSAGTASASVPPLWKNKAVKLAAAAAAVVLVIFAVSSLFGGRSDTETAEQFFDAAFDADAEAIMDLIPKDLVDAVMEESGYTRSEVEEEFESLADQLEAQVRQTNVEAVQAQRAQREAELRRAVESSPEMQSLRAQKEALERREAQRTFADDLATVKRYNKAEKAASVEELGETFLRARAMGLDPLAAYDLVQKERERSAAQRPPEIGAVAAGTGGDKGYYTEAELDRLTGKDLDDPGILAKAVASLSRLKR